MTVYCWANIKTTLVQCLVYANINRRPISVSLFIHSYYKPVFSSGGSCSCSVCRGACNYSTRRYTGSPVNNSHGHDAVSLMADGRVSRTSAHPASLSYVCRHRILNTCSGNTAVQIQKTVSAYFTSEQKGLLHFGFAEQSTALQSQNAVSAHL